MAAKVSPPGFSMDLWRISSRQPATAKTSTLVTQVKARTHEEMQHKVEELMQHCEGASRAGANGAKAKLAYALRAVESGTNVFIGHARHHIGDLLTGAVPCTRLILEEN